VSKTKYVPILNQLPNEDLRRELYKKWEADDTHSISGAERWHQLRDATTASRDKDDISGKKRARVNYAELESWRVELVMKYCYPRLDVNVSKAQNHLLKSPFCVHPKTGRVCIPIDPKEADDFDPFKVPTVRSLCAQIDAYEGPDVDDMDKTDMKMAMDVFERSFMSDLRSTIRRDFRDRADEARAIGMDF
jgi:DNA primase small subunit